MAPYLKNNGTSCRHGNGSTEEPFWLRLFCSVSETKNKGFDFLCVDIPIIFVISGFFLSKHIYRGHAIRTLFYDIP